MKKYSDVSGIIKKKEEHRRALAALSFEEKIEVVFKLRARREAIKSAREGSSPRKPKTKKA